ncbi:beta-D-glucosyl crocetin beta-1,6-glucosyltransferase-like [Coffea arabica]|uniref:Beta-D-glucosyl crocetin beta-1,6-glucosyltransferase-like n=1 Tax=Coffea arabica TaxID=13443 RepID=A0A6P6VCL2_COFAR|nr:beta-D-glucosyl crocetin beta-1,6-glucosyltransferase-like [Coffea arabica]
MLCQLPAGPMLVNTSRWIEGTYMDHAAHNLNRKILPVGPLVQYPAAAPEGEEQHQNIDLIQWLAEKEEHSAVFASFGSEYFLTKEEILEVAFGLELSDNVNVIWALRLPKGEENRVQLEQILPEGFSREILEAIEFGVPILAMPMNYEQPLNARLMVENGLAVEIMRDEKGDL